ncbi:hypothetical protein MBLNU457_6290t3 [Dothideomycetes sp. NU457]
MSSSLKTQPPATKYLVLTYPTPEILLVRLNRPKSLNCISSEGNAELAELWQWFDSEPSLCVAIITGTGRAFCAGADLKEWNDSNSSNRARPIGPMGFGSLSRRGGKKPIIAAVNGICFGGGCEMIVNADMVIASKNAQFALPEVKRGVVAMAGALPRIVRTIGRVRAMEMALTGRVVMAEEAERWGLINRVVGDEEGKVVGAAVEAARMIAENSPDAVQVSREGIKLGWEGVGAEEGSRLLLENWYPRLQEGENLKEGVRAFVEKRKPRWVASKL